MREKPDGAIQQQALFSLVFVYIIPCSDCAAAASGTILRPAPRALQPLTLKLPAFVRIRW